MKGEGVGLEKGSGFFFDWVPQRMVLSFQSKKNPDPVRGPVRESGPRLEPVRSVS